MSMAQRIAQKHRDKIATAGSAIKKQLGRHTEITLVYQTKTEKISPRDTAKIDSLTRQKDFLGYADEWRPGKYEAIYWPPNANSGVTVTLHAWTPNDAANYIRAKHEEVVALAANAEAELEKALKAHDWYSAMSDDPRYYHAGERSMEKIKTLMAIVPQEVGERLWKKYAPPEIKWRG